MNNNIKNIGWIIILQVIFCLSVIPYYIPSLEEMMIVISCLLQLPILFFAGKIVWSYKKESHIKIIIITLSLLIEIGLIFSFTALGFGQGIFGAYYLKTIPIKNYQTIFYVYDNSFLDPSTKVFVSHGFSPIMTVIYQDRVSPSMLSTKQKGDTIIFMNGNYMIQTIYNLRTKKVILSEPIN